LITKELKPVIEILLLRGQYAPDCEANFKFRGSVSAGLSQFFFYK